MLECLSIQTSWDVSPTNQGEGVLVFDLPRDEEHWPTLQNCYTISLHSPWGKPEIAFRGYEQSMSPELLFDISRKFSLGMVIASREKVLDPLK